MRGVGLVVGATGLFALSLWLVGAVVAPGAAALGWLVAWSAAVDAAIGALVLVLLAHVAPIRWFTPLRPAMTGIAALLGPLALLFLPVAFGFEALYPWAGAPPELGPHERAILAARRTWFEPVGWRVRAAIVLAAWTALAWGLRRLERHGEGASILRARRLSAGGLVLLGVTWTVGTVDWWMGLDPVWFSAILPMQRFAGAGTSGVALAVIAARQLERRGALPPLPPDLYHALGRLMLVFVILWTYTTYDQLMIQWIAGIPHEIRYWIPRLGTPWLGVAWALGLGHFVLPFALLLSRAFKRNPRALEALASWLLAMRLLDAIHAVAPGHPAAGLPALALGALALLAHAGLLVPAAFALNRGPVPEDALPFGLGYRSR